MSTPVIPNLNNFRRGGNRRGGRGRDITVGGAESSSGNNEAEKEKIIQSTDLDAATSRLSAVEAGYLDDPFARLLTHTSNNVARKLPLINRGTYVRTTAIDRLVEAFLGADSKDPRQIISLGAGSDTRFFRLKHQHPDISLIYHEFDFPVNTAAKIGQMQKTPFVQSVQRLCGIVLPPRDNTMSTGDDDGNRSFQLQADQAWYHLHALDLRNLTGPGRERDQIEEEFTQLGISVNVPTLVLSECCLIYLAPEVADAVLSYFTSPFPPMVAVGIVIYEPIRPHDPFGRTMVSNLTARGIHLQTLNAHDSLAVQKERLRAHGCETAHGGGSELGGAQAADVDFLWQAWIQKGEKDRVEGLEWMDEVEEWRLLARHYCVAWGWKQAADETRNPVFHSWATLPVQDDEGQNGD